MQKPCGTSVDGCRNASVVLRLCSGAWPPWAGEWEEEGEAGQDDWHFCSPARHQSKGVNGMWRQITGVCLHQTSWKFQQNMPDMEPAVSSPRTIRSWRLNMCELPRCKAPVCKFSGKETFMETGCRWMFNYRCNYIMFVWKRSCRI